MEIMNRNISSDVNLFHCLITSISFTLKYLFTPRTELYVVYCIYQSHSTCYIDMYIMFCRFLLYTTWFTN